MKVRKKAIKGANFPPLYNIYLKRLHYAVVGFKLAHRKMSLCGETIVATKIIVCTFVVF